ncbi:hypothetical protein PSTT_03176 [Puccinia striiformis]|uniref:RxLR effector candidate protein n=1 Tax=Puccinia striiformis TaxID=27350 RepID=A0A2S4VX85_9BASI|nr:hypothetical protein PSTT_03176 [Puccinia striiformis]
MKHYLIDSLVLISVFNGCTRSVSPQAPSTPQLIDATHTGDETSVCAVANSGLKASLRPQPLQNPKSITASADYHLDILLPKNIPKSNDVAPRLTQDTSNAGHGSLEGSFFGQADRPATSHPKDSAAVLKQLSRKVSRKSLVIKHPLMESNKNYLQADQIEKLNQWKSGADVSHFVAKLELSVMKIVNAIIYFEVSILDPKDLLPILTRFTDKSQFIGISQTFTKLVHDFITDVYRSRVGSNQFDDVLHAFRKNEYGIYKSYGQSRTYMLASIEIEEYMDMLILGASKYYHDAKDEMDIWQDQVHSVIQMLKFFEGEMSPFKHKQSVLKLLRSQLYQIKARSGDVPLFEFLQDSAEKGIPVDKIQSFLLLNTKGINPEHRAKLFRHVENIHEDMLTVYADSGPPLKWNHRNALDLQWN